MSTRTLPLDTHPRARSARRAPLGGLVLPVLALLSLTARAAEEPGRPDVVVADFEGEDYGDWSVEGEAFGKGPARGTLPNQMAVSGYEGRGLVNSFTGGDRTTGRLLSPSFTITRRHMRFLIGGGRHPAETRLDLLHEGRAVRTTTGIHSEALEMHAWDVSDLEGKEVRLEIRDNATGGWGHINVDHIVLTDTKPDIGLDRDRLLARAEASVKAAEARAASDPRRPLAHFTPAAQWMNDPNGTIYHEGWYHVFFQHNPYGDRWGHMHWGHARSRDLVHWERLPIALWPSKDLGEDHVFSGCAWRRADGKVILHYTSVGEGRPNEQWAALPRDGGLIAWDKLPQNPLLTTRGPGELRFGDGMRDPFLFEAGGKTFLAIGADLKDEAVIPVYEATSPALDAWDYRGILWRAPRSVMEFPECPNFFPLDGRWVLLNSPYRPVEFRVGSLDLETMVFTEAAQGRVDESDQYYATNIAFDTKGGKPRCVLFGWVRGFPEGKGWNGCLAMPRIATVGEDGGLRQRFAPEIAALRGSGERREGVALTKAGVALARGGEALELRVSIEPRGASRVGIRLAGSSGDPVEIAHDGKRLTVAGHAFPFELEPGERALTLHAVFDRSVLEVIINGRRGCTRVVAPALPLRAIDGFAEGGEAVAVEVEAWPLKGIW